MIDRASIFRGEIVRRDETPESLALASIALRRVAEAFACEPDALRTLHERHDLGESWKRTCDARAAIATDAEAKRASVALACALGFDCGRLAFDPPRLRVVSPRAHERPAAARAYYMHRDTWYGSPAAQVNVWIPLFDVDERDSFAIWPAALGVRIANDSSAFDYDRFASRGGFQSAAVIDAAYPRTMETRGEPFHVRARAGELIAFSAAHLHATTPNATRATRISIDVRFVDLDDHASGRGAPDGDNASRGSALVDYLRGEP